MGVISMLFSQSTSFIDLLLYTCAILVTIVLVLPLHELAHGYVAYKLGDNTAKYSGRLTLNPLAHIDPFGALSLFLVGFGWAKPVPVNALYFKKPKRDMALTALAGPASNFIAALFGGILLNIFFKLGWIYGMIFASFYIRVNVFLAVFNLIPIPPLDGSKILMRFLPDHLVYKLYRNEQVCYMVLVVLLFTGILDVPLTFIQNAALNFVVWLTSLPFGA